MTEQHEPHPFRVAFETRDLDRWMSEFAPDAVARSPMVARPFVGREALRIVYAALFSAFGSFEVVSEFHDEASSTFFWKGEMGGAEIEGVDLLRRDGEGKIAEATVFIRPLTGLGDFGATVGPLVARSRGRIWGLVGYLVAAPLRALLSLIDNVASYVVLGRGA